MDRESPSFSSLPTADSAAQAIQVFWCGCLATLPSGGAAKQQVGAVAAGPSPVTAEATGSAGVGAQL